MKKKSPSEAPYFNRFPLPLTGFRPTIYTLFRLYSCLPPLPSPRKAGLNSFSPTLTSPSASCAGRFSFQSIQGQDFGGDVIASNLGASGFSRRNGCLFLRENGEASLPQRSMGALLPGQMGGVVADPMWSSHPQCPGHGHAVRQTVLPSTVTDRARPWVVRACRRGKVRIQSNLAAKDHGQTQSMTPAGLRLIASRWASGPQRKPWKSLQQLRR